MTNTIHLGLPYIAASQAQKHVTHNEALRALDALVMLAVLDRDLTSPPEAPEEGARYLVPDDGTGVFAGRDGQVAHFRDGAFAFHVPQAGWIAYVQDEAALIVFDGEGWVPLNGTEPQLQNVARLGIGTEADAVNPLAAKLNNALWTARAVAEGGDGNLRYKLNKESSGNTLSMLFQTGYSGRAEIGLAGDDDLRLKVSGDGATWRDGIVIASNSGKVSFPRGVIGLREKLTAPRTYYVRPDGSNDNDGLSNTPGGAFQTIQKAIDVVFGTLDLGGFNVTIQLGDGTYSGGLAQASPQVGAGLVTLQGNASNPQNVVVTGVGAHAVYVSNGAVLHVKDFEVRTTGSGHGLRADTGASLSFANMRIGTCAGHQIRASDGGSVTCTGNYAIVGGGSSHWNLVGGGLIRCQGRTITLSGTPAYTTAFVHAQLGGLAVVDGNTFSGSATGARYVINTNSVVFVNGAGVDHLPGNAAGSAATGAQYQ